MTIISKDVVSVKKIMEMSLVIPDYQRPYKWQAEHVNQLFDDVLHHRGLGVYRLGTVVLCREQSKDTLDIVDGQQRLLTLTLLIDALYREVKQAEQPVKLQLLTVKFSSPNSIENLSHNAALLQSRVRRLERSEEHT